MRLDIVIFEADEVASGLGQARYLVHGHDDVLWTDDIDAAVEYLRQCLEEIKGGGAA